MTDERDENAPAGATQATQEETGVTGAAVEIERIMGIVKQSRANIADRTNAHGQYTQAQYYDILGVTRPTPAPDPYEPLSDPTTVKRTEKYSSAPRVGFSREVAAAAP